MYNTPRKRQRAVDDSFSARSGGASAWFSNGMALKSTIYKAELQIANMDRHYYACLLYTSPSPRDGLLSRMPSSA